MIDFDEVLCADKYAFMERKSNIIKSNILSSVKALFFTRLNIPASKSCQYIFFRSLVRDDYSSIFREVASQIPDDKKVVVEDYVESTKYPDIRSIFVLFRFFTKLFVFSSDSFYERLCLYIRLCSYYRHVLKIEKIEFEVMVCFADMQPVENLLSQYFGDKGKITITMQHGLYVDYGEYPTVNAINYLHQPSRYFLSWGDSTKKLINKYHPKSTVVVCGKPSFIPYRENVRPVQSDGFFTVIMDQNIFSDENKRMLALMSDYSTAAGIAMNVRFHPDNDKEVYQRLDIEFVEDRFIESSMFVVGHTSSMIYELLYCGIPTFKYASEIPFVELPEELIFSSVRELELLLKKELNFSEIGKQYIACTGEDSLSAYADFFSQLNELELS